MASNNIARMFSSGILSKHELFKIVGDQLTQENVKELLDKHRDVFSSSLSSLIVDGFSFFLALESVRHVDTSEIVKVLRLVRRMDLAQFASYRRRKTVEMDPVDQYLEQTAKSSVLLPSWMQHHKPWLHCSLRNKQRSPASSSSVPGTAAPPTSSSSSSSSSRSTAVHNSTLSQPSTSQALVPSGNASSSNSSKLTSGVKRKRRRSSLTYNKTFNRLKRSRTAEALTLQPPEASGTPINQQTASREQVGRVTHSRTRSAGVIPTASSSRTGKHPSEPSNSLVVPQAKRKPSNVVDTMPKRRKVPSGNCGCAKSMTASTEAPKADLGSCLYFEEIKKKVTCDIRLRVRAEYCYHDNALIGNIFSNKPELIERQFEKFMQANTILKSRDLGSIICDIKFSELTYLDAFWRDYINGSLLEALKGVFITDSLKQAVGHEAIKLLVNVDEDDYESGRFKLLQNLKD